jgi:hypothetical protein
MSAKDSISFPGKNQEHASTISRTVRQKENEAAVRKLRESACKYSVCADRVRNSKLLYPILIT